jgi:hypothetical protein
MSKRRDSWPTSRPRSSISLSFLGE